MSDQHKPLYLAVGLIVVGAIMTATGSRQNAVVAGIGISCMILGVLCGIAWVITLIVGPGKNKEWPDK